MNYHHLTLAELLNVASIDAATPLERALLAALEEADEEREGAAQEAEEASGREQEAETAAKALAEALHDLRERMDRADVDGFTPENMFELLSGFIKDADAVLEAHPDYTP